MKVSVEMEKTDWMAILSHTEADRQEALARGETEAAERMEKFKSAIHKGLFKSATGERT